VRISAVLHIIIIVYIEYYCCSCCCRYKRFAIQHQYANTHDLWQYVKGTLATFTTLSCGVCATAHRSQNDRFVFTRAHTSVGRVHTYYVSLKYTHRRLSYRPCIMYYYNNMCTIILSYSCDSVYIYRYTTYIYMYDTRRSRCARYGVLLRRRVRSASVHPSVTGYAFACHRPLIFIPIFAGVTRDRYIIARV